MKRYALTVGGAVVTAAVGVGLVGVVAPGLGDESTIGPRFIAGFALVGFLVGCVSSWFARSMPAALAAAGIILLLLHIPDVPHNLGAATAQLLASWLAAAAGVFLVGRVRFSRSHRRA